MELEEFAPLPRGLDEPRYKESPINFFFEDLILDVLGELPPDQSQKTQALNLQRIFKTEATEWRSVIREVLHLSDTIDIAILDLWLKNKENLRREGLSLHPLAYAQEFVDHFFAEESQVDVWTPSTLEAAKARVAKYRAAIEPL